VDDGTAQLAEIDADAPVTARVTPMSVVLTRLDTLPPVHEDLDDTLGFLGGMFLAQDREQLRLISGHNKEHSGHLPAFPIQGIVAPEGPNGELLEDTTSVCGLGRAVKPIRTWPSPSWRGRPSPGPVRPASCACARSWRQRQPGPLQVDLFVPQQAGYEFKVIATNKTVSPATILAFHNGHGAQEGLFAQLKTQCQLDYVPCRRLVGNQLFLHAAVLGHNLGRELQMAARPPERATRAERAKALVELQKHWRCYSAGRWRASGHDRHGRGAGRAARQPRGGHVSQEGPGSWESAS
jgi:hypothetical protein